MMFIWIKHIAEIFKRLYTYTNTHTDVHKKYARNIIMNSE